MTLHTEDRNDKSNPPPSSALDYHALAREAPEAIWVGGVPWKKVGPILSPLCMPHVPISVDRAELRKVIKRHKALVARWTTEWNTATSEWWWVCCDKPDYDVETIESSRARRGIRAGLRACPVRIVSAEEFAPMAYPIFCKALNEYGLHTPTESDYAETIRQMALYPGTEFWGAFVGDTLAAFATCQIIDGAVTLGSTKSDPEMNKHNVNGALFYAITRHYLQRGMSYVSNGCRTLYHPTTIDDFLERMGFRKVFCRLNVELSGIASVIHATRLVRWTKWLGAPFLFSKQWPQLVGFDKLMRISESFR
jgi:hypothetical protein